MPILTARWVLPMDCQPRENYEVVVEGDRIAEIRPRRTPANEVQDFGDAILMPGLVNAHTHIEYTLLRGFLEDVPFFPWIRALTAAKAHYLHDDWLVSAKLGAYECLAAGITTIGDNTDSGVSLQAALETGLRGIVYQELFGIDHREPIAPIIANLKEKLAAHRVSATDRVQIGVSPHAPYTIRPELFAALRELFDAEPLPISIHVAESPAESELIERGTGPFAEMFARRKIDWPAPHVTPTRYVADQGMLGPNTLAIHCVHQTDEDISLTAHMGASIIHCPKSNAKLGAGIAPLKSWLATDGLRLGIGTDSAVSNNTHDLFEEMRFGLFLQRANSEDVAFITAKHMVELATNRGAEAMGLGSEIGTLTAGKRADVIAVDLRSLHVSPATDPYAALVYAARADDVRFTMVDGVALYDSGRFLETDTVEETRRRAIVLRQRAPQPPILGESEKGRHPAPPELGVGGHPAPPGSEAARA